jgi:hypothetical protein
MRRSRYCEALGAGKSKVQTPTHAKFTGPVQNSLQPNLASCAMVLVRLSEDKEAGS